MRNVLAPAAFLLTLQTNRGSAVSAAILQTAAILASDVNPSDVNPSDLNP